MPKIIFIHPDGRSETEIEAGKTLLDAAQKCSAPMEYACGGNGFCTTCKCRVKNGRSNLSLPNEREENMGIEGESGDRLGCQAKVFGDAEVELVE